MVFNNKLFGHRLTLTITIDSQLLNNSPNNRALITGISVEILTYDTQISQRSITDVVTCVLDSAHIHPFS